MSQKQNLWMTGGSDSSDCVEVNAGENEIAIWQHLAGNIQSVTMDLELARQVAHYILAIT